MKTLLLAISLATAILSTQAHAEGPAILVVSAGITLSPLLPFAATGALTTITSMKIQGSQKEAIQILNEGQDYLVSGEIGLLMARKVEALQEEQDMSDDEAVSLLMNAASEILK